MKKLLIALPLLALSAVGIGWLARRDPAPPEVPFARVRRGTLESLLVTNGKVEPIEWTAVRAGREGHLKGLAVVRGQRVLRGTVLAELDAREARAELAAAESRIAQARAEIEVFDRGGPAAELVEIDSGIARARADLEIARRELASATRLIERKAAPAIEGVALRDRVRQGEALIAALSRKRAALVTPGGRAAAEARMLEATAAAELAGRKIAAGRIEAPMDGVVYQLDVREGAYVRPGDPVAEIGRLERLRVLVYVDEPDLGRVEMGMPVTITWDARPGRAWTGTIEKLPARIIALGSRQVGEVTCHIDNAGLALPPGANINAEIRSRRSENALRVPKEALRREVSGNTVFVLQGDRVVRRPVQVGTASITHAEIVTGLAENDAVALPTEVPLRDGQRVRAKVQ